MFTVAREDDFLILIKWPNFGLINELSLRSQNATVVGKRFWEANFWALSENAGWSKKESDSEWQHKTVGKEGPHLQFS